MQGILGWDKSKVAIKTIDANHFSMLGLSDEKPPDLNVIAVTHKIIEKFCKHKRS